MHYLLYIPYSQCHRGPQSSDNPLLVSHTTVRTVTQCVNQYTKEWFASIGCSSRHMSITHCILIYDYQSSSDKMSSTDVQHCQSKLFSNSTTKFDLTVSFDCSAWAVILGSW